MSKPRIMLRVQKGALVPADQYSANVLRERKYRTGDILAAELRKPRNYGNHKKAHLFATLLRENLDRFTHLEEHAILKRLQIEGDIACDYIHLNMPGIGPVDYRMPKSLSYESMDEGEFLATYDAFCAYVAKEYWPDMTADQIAGMAELTADSI